MFRRGMQLLDQMLRLRINSDSLQRARASHSRPKMFKVWVKSLTRWLAARPRRVYAQTAAPIYRRIAATSGRGDSRTMHAGIRFVGGVKALSFAAYLLNGCIEQADKLATAMTILNRWQPAVIQSAVSFWHNLAAPDVDAAPMRANCACRRMTAGLDDQIAFDSRAARTARMKRF